MLIKVHTCFNDLDVEKVSGLCIDLWPAVFNFSLIARHIIYLQNIQYNMKNNIYRV